MMPPPAVASVVAPLIAAVGGTARGPSGIWSAGTLPATLVLPAILLAGAYARGRIRLASTGRRPPAARTAAFAAGLAAVLLATASPLEAMAVQLLSAHMVQHLLLIVVAPVLLAAARPSPVLHAGAVAALGDRGAEGLRRLQRTAAVRRWRRWQRLPSAAPALGLAWTAHITITSAWHLPTVYDAALRVPVVHALEHATLLLSALVAWQTTLRARAGRPSAVALFGIVGAAGASGLLAALLTFSARPWYPVYTRTAPAWGLTALQDQQLAGAVMWVAGGLCYLAMGALLFARWLTALDRVPPARPPARLRSGAGCWALVALAAVATSACGVEDHQLDPEQVDAVRAGREALVAYGCVGCHAVPGTTVTQGRVGPPLAGIASRQVIAGRLPNTPANLARWIREPQRIDPGNAMPDLGVTEADAAAIVAYLGTLE